MAKILLIDDDEINNFTVDAILKQVDFINKYVIKDNGWDALGYLQSVEATDDFPDLIFVDINMPEMDGFEFIERYEAVFWVNHQHTKIKMLSSSMSEKDRSKALNFSCVSDYVFKPLTKNKLADLIN